MEGTGGASGQYSSEDAAQSLGQRVDQLGNTAQEAWMRTRDTFTELKQSLDIDGRVRRNPYGTMAAAVGIGYILGGGIFSSLTARILGLGVRVGIRLAAIPFLEEMVGSLEGGGRQQYGEPESQTTNKG